jgi:hypothetical protein
MTVDLASLITVAKNMKAISDFIYGKGLNQAVSDIVGDIHINAAKLALETARIAVNQKDRINSVITHLEAAHIAYSKNLKQYQGKYAKLGYDSLSIVETYHKNVLVCCLMALCYASLGESRAARNSVTRAESYLALFDRLPETIEGHWRAAGFIISIFLNPRNYTRLSVINDDMGARNLAEFKATLERTLA